MNYQFKFSPGFWKQFSALTAEEKTKAINKMFLLAENPQHPSLRSKSVQGFPYVFESSVNMDIRILWQYKDNRVMLLSDIGHHDILKRF